MEARDNGPVYVPKPAWMTVEVIIEVTSNSLTLPPIWQPFAGSPIDDIDDIIINENSTALTPLEVYPHATGVGTSSLYLYLQRDRTDYQNNKGDFTHRQLINPADTLEILVSRLDYETTPWYSLRLSASVSGFFELY